MQPIVNGNDLLKTPQILRISILFLAAIAAFYLGKHWSDGSYPQFIFFNASSNSADSAASSGGTVAISPNANLTVNLPDLIPSSPPPSPPPPPARYGVVDENGTMRTDFDVGEFDPDLEDSGGGRGGGNNETREESDGGARVRVRVGKFRVCDEGMREYIPCLDNVEAIKRLRSTERGERFERFCPEKALDCLVPAPKDYKLPIPWPQSREEVFSPLTLTANFC